jgi:hypothetical protein
VAINHIEAELPEQRSQAELGNEHQAELGNEHKDRRYDAFAMVNAAVRCARGDESAQLAPWQLDRL